MKNSVIYSIGIFLLAGFVLFSGCKKDDEVGPTVTISNLGPDPAFQGDEVSLTGENLNTVLHVFVGLIEVDFTLSGNTMTFVVPLTAEVGENVVTLAMDNKYRETAKLTVELIPTPVIKTFDAWVPIGEEIVITGTSLDNNTTLTIGGVQATITSNTDTELKATVPSGIPDDQLLEIEVATTYGSYVATTPFLARENFIFNGQLDLGEGDEFEGWEKLNGGDQMTSVIGVDAFGGGRSMRVVGAAMNPWNTALANRKSVV
ncbi:MAG: IPT/TIG domain-containing protein, partial [Phaeodactylibacter sp.]|nr:IPT/TIG domain-containing protein [Phaeodactylibacter sp.]